MDLTDIQGNILRGYNFDRAFHLFLEIGERRSAKRFLGRLADLVTNAEPWDDKPRLTLNVALTFRGLERLGVRPDVLDALPPAFREVTSARAERVFGDTPGEWDEGLRSGRADVLVLVAGQEGRGATVLPAAAGAVAGSAEDHELGLVHVQEVKALPHRREHFGWADGLAQPAIEGVEPARAGGGVPLDDAREWRPLKPGEFILGYPDEDGQVVSGPARSLLMNGSFMVYRKLQQDVVRFREALHEQAQVYGDLVHPRLTPQQRYELLAAKVMGRWRDGAALELYERADDPPDALGARHLDKNDVMLSNNFRYRDRDANGFRCPKGAHVRRANPRDDDGLDGRATRRHRIIRRGMPYGPQHMYGEPDDGVRGLIFICFNADIERQFETVMTDYIGDGNIFGLGADQDYLLGGEGKHTVQGRPPYFAPLSAEIVVTKGCEYLLTPGIEALRELAEP